MLVASLTRSRTAGIVSAPIFGLSPFFMAHGMGHMNIISAEFVPIFALNSYAALTTGKLRHGVLAGIWFGLGALCDLEYVILNGTVLVLSLIHIYSNTFEPPTRLPPGGRRRTDRNRHRGLGRVE